MVSEFNIGPTCIEGRNILVIGFRSENMAKNTRSTTIIIEINNRTGVTCSYKCGDLILNNDSIPARQLAQEVTYQYGPNACPMKSRGGIQSIIYLPRLRLRWRRFKRVKTHLGHECSSSCRGAMKLGAGEQDNQNTVKKFNIL
jgi:hypothetical protein